MKKLILLFLLIIFSIQVLSIPSINLNESSIFNNCYGESIPTVYLESANYTGNLSDIYVKKTGGTMSGSLINQKNVTAQRLNSFYGLLLNYNQADLIPYIEMYGGSHKGRFEWRGDENRFVFNNNVMVQDDMTLYFGNNAINMSGGLTNVLNISSKKINLKADTVNVNGNITGHNGDANIVLSAPNGEHVGTYFYGPNGEYDFGTSSAFGAFTGVRLSSAYGQFQVLYEDNVIYSFSLSDGMMVGPGDKQRNITMYSPDLTAWNCGVDNSGVFSCT